MVLIFSAVRDCSGPIPIASPTKTASHTLSRTPAFLPQPYPTPPSSPDLEDGNEDKDVRPVADAAAEPYTPPRSRTQSQLHTPTHSRPQSRSHSPLRLPISLDLSTEHPLPHAGALRLASGTGILAALGGNRVLQLSASSVWERMPYAAAVAQIEAQADAEVDAGAGQSAAGGSGASGGSGLAHANRRAIMTEEAKEEEDVEGILGIPRKSKAKPAHISSILVHPPTPERAEAAPLTPPLSSPPMETSPNGTLRSLAGLSANGTTIPMHVLPEVRSPPRRTIAMAADSLQLSTRRGRRPRLFGFTEMGDSSGSSAGSSLAGSRSNSPERKVAIEHHVSPLAYDSIHQVSPIAGPSTHSHSGPASGLTLPRRGPQRTQSETHLPTITSRSATNSGPIKPHAAPHAPAPNHQKPRRENGLKLDFTGIVPVAAPADATPGSSYTSPYSAKLIRKKSGEILKPALKYGGPLTASGTPMDEAGPRSASPRYESKSLPATPSFPKYVHFDAQLERVKLFNKDHKPRVVSRDGSPTNYTTSEGEEYPFPSTDDEAISGPQKKVLQIKLPNFPTSHPPDSDLHLESLFLEDDRKSLKGVVMCRNFAYSKWVAVRFTFDWWQTTSEVSAVYKDNVKGGKYDRFTFQIKLADIMPKIEEKTLFICVRFNTDGREIWDSNGGGNYQVLFEKVAPPAPEKRGARYTPTIQAGMGKAVGGRKSQWALSGNEGDRMADLREKLNRLTADDPDAAVQLSPNRTGGFNWANAGKRGGGGSPTGSPRKNSLAGDVPPAGAGLAARYDFGAALKGARRSSNSPNMRSVDLPNVRTGLLQFGRDVRDSSWNAAPVPVAPSWSGAMGMSMGIGMDHSVSSPVRGPAGPASDPTPTSAYVESPIPIPASTMAPLVVPAVQVQGPSPSPPTSPIAAKRPGLPRSQTSPAVLPAPLRSVSPAFSSPSTPKAAPLLHLNGRPDDSPSSTISTPSPPGLHPSGSSTETLPETSSVPASPADVALGLTMGAPVDTLGVSGAKDPRPVLAQLGMAHMAGDERRDSVSSASGGGSGSGTWSPTLSDDSDVSRASYSSFIEQFCWGGGGAASYFSGPGGGGANGHMNGHGNDLSVPEPPRRVHSTSSLDQYFQPAEHTNGNGHGPGHGLGNGHGHGASFSPGHHHSYSFSHSASFISQMHGHPRGPSGSGVTTPKAAGNGGWAVPRTPTPTQTRSQTQTPVTSASVSASTQSSGGTSWYSAYSGSGYGFGRDARGTGPETGTGTGVGSPSPTPAGAAATAAAKREEEVGSLEHALRKSFEPHAHHAHGAHGHGHGHAIYGSGMSGMPGNMSPPVRAGV